MSQSFSSKSDSEESYCDLPFEFRIKDHDSDVDNNDDSFNCDDDNEQQQLEGSESRLSQQEMISSHLDVVNLQGNKDLYSSLNEQNLDMLADLDTNNASVCNFSIRDQVVVSAANTSVDTKVSSEQRYEQQQNFTPHKGALKQIANPQTNTSDPYQPLRIKEQSQWPIYSITIKVEQTNDAKLQSPSSSLYQILYSRSQYEQCIKLFTLLDTECKSSLGPECVKEFVWRYCPVVRRRDDALSVLNVSKTGDTRLQQSKLLSYTFDEIWKVVIESDTRSEQYATSHSRIGLEGWMVFTRLLSLTSHLEHQRRFASRHLQQMMRHKYGNGSDISHRMNPNEVVVVIDNPPAGPPVPISIRGLMDVEFGLGKEKPNVLVANWPYASLPMIQLDLDNTVRKFKDYDALWNHKRKLVIHPFSASSRGDFIIRSSKSHNTDKTTVVRRSYADLRWLNETLVTQTRQGQGNLCGRILPPFPQRHASSSRGVRAKYNESRPRDASERAVAAAKSGVEKITSVAKALWGNYISPTNALNKSPSSLPVATKQEEIPEHYSWPGLLNRDEDVSHQLARRMDRYLSYLLDNRALSSSFPLNAMLTASQSGLECSKQILDEYTKQRKRRRNNQYSILNGGASSAHAVLSILLAKKPCSYFNLQDGDDTPWIRVAARTAMSLQFHGILEATGRESTSAKIQHASLPKFGTATSSWDEEEPYDAKDIVREDDSQIETIDEDFEVGVVSDDIEGYDLLPSPGPSEEHHVLNATNNATSFNEEFQTMRPTRLYMTPNTSNELPDMMHGMHTQDSVTLGPVKVDNDIDKLQGIIKTMDSTLKRLFKSSIVIESVQASRNALQLNLLKDIESCGSNHGFVISQRSLVDGVESLRESNTVLSTSNANISDGLGWQSALASSAVGAAKEVKEAVLASRTAARAKTAAFRAAAKSKMIYESLDSSSSTEEINFAQSEATSSQSRAIHATVIEYESNIAKKRAAVSLAEDVKHWNVYRKRELRQVCLEYAKSQQEACRRTAYAWECLLDGLVDSSTILFSPKVNVPAIPEQTHVNDEIDVPGDSIVHDNHNHATKSIQDPIANVSSLEEFVDINESTKNALNFEDSFENVYMLRSPDTSNLDDYHFALQEDIIPPIESSSQSESETKGEGCGGGGCYESNFNEENMTTSMQTLIDGLMTWGGEEPVNDIGSQIDGK